jgi:hypothetical protein
MFTHHRVVRPPPASAAPMSCRHRPPTAATTLTCPPPSPPGAIGPGPPPLFSLSIASSIKEPSRAPVRRSSIPRPPDHDRARPPLPRPSMAPFVHPHRGSALCVTGFRQVATANHPSRSDLPALDLSPICGCHVTPLHPPVLQDLTITTKDHRSLSPLKNHRRANCLHRLAIVTPLR